MHQQDIAFEAGRLQGLLQVQEQPVAVDLAGFEGAGEHQFVLEYHGVESAVGLHGNLRVGALDAASAVAGDVVPDDFQRAGGEGEGHGAGIEILQAVAAGDHGHLGRGGSRPLKYLRGVGRCRDSAPATPPARR